MNPHGVSDQLNLEKLSSGCLRVARVRQKPATPCVEIVKHKTINLKRSNIMIKKRGRVVGLDVHPDSFAGAVVAGSDPASAQVSSTSTRVELERLEQWALRHTRTEDTLVLEASGVATPFRWRSACAGSGAKSRSWTVIVRVKWARSIAPTIESMR